MMVTRKLEPSTASSSVLALDLAGQKQVAPKTGKTLSSRCVAGDLLAPTRLSRSDGSAFSLTPAAYSTLMTEGMTHVARQAWHQARFLHQSLMKTNLGRADYKLYARSVEPLEALIEGQDEQNTVGPHFLTYSDEAGASVQGLRMDLLRAVVANTTKLFDLLQNPDLSETFVRANGREALVAVQADAAQKATSAAARFNQLTAGIAGHVAARLQDPYIKSDPYLAHVEKLPLQIKDQLQTHEAMLHWFAGRKLQGNVFSALDTKRAISAWDHWRQTANENIFFAIWTR